MTQCADTRLDRSSLRPELRITGMMEAVGPSLNAKASCTTPVYHIETAPHHIVLDQIIYLKFSTRLKCSQSAKTRLVSDVCVFGFALKQRRECS